MAYARRRGPLRFPLGLIGFGLVWAATLAWSGDVPLSIPGAVCVALGAFILFKQLSYRARVRRAFMHGRIVSATVESIAGDGFFTVVCVLDEPAKQSPYRGDVSPQKVTFSGAANFPLYFRPGATVDILWYDGDPELALPLDAIEDFAHRSLSRSA